MMNGGPATTRQGLQGIDMNAGTGNRGDAKPFPMSQSVYFTSEEKRQMEEKTLEESKFRELFKDCFDKIKKRMK